LDMIILLRRQLKTDGTKRSVVQDSAVSGS